MSTVQWLILILIVVIVVGAYLYIRHSGGRDPWHDMEDPGSSSEGGAGGGGESYVVGVRKISAREADQQKTEAEAKATRESHQANEHPGQEHPRQPTVVRRRAAPKPRIEPELEEIEPEPETAPEPEFEPTPTPQTVASAPKTPVAAEEQTGAADRLDMVAPTQTQHSQLFRLYVTATQGYEFQGPAIQEALLRANLKFGLNDLFHRITETHGVTESVFCVANMLNPGTLDPVDQDHLSTPGLALFLMVPGPLEGRQAMKDMMETAHQLAQDLEGQVLDDNRSSLKIQTAQYMFDQIAEIERQDKLAQRR